MANEIQKIVFLVPPTAKAGNEGGTATQSQKQKPQVPLPASDEANRVVAPKSAEPVKAKTNTHLVIEKDEVSGGYVYKSVDPQTGEVLQQFPREEVLRAIAAMRAAEGQILDTKA
jgi:flagellar protein FlaG